MDHAKDLYRAISLALSTVACGSAPPATTQVMELPTVSVTATAPAPPSTLVQRPHHREDVQPIVVTRPMPTKSRKRNNIVVEGRPFIVAGSPRVAALQCGDGWAEHVDMGGATCAERDALVRHYVAWALAEHASIASFARFTLQLLALGAPSALVARAVEAMADETRHARFGFGLVHALSGVAVAPAELPMHRALDGDTSLESVLRLVVREGIIGETLSALEVRHAADLAEIPTLREALATIAAEEARHAELAFVFAAWALEQDRTLGAVIDEELACWEAPALPVVSGLERWGILDESSRERVRADGIERVVKPLARRAARGGASPRPRHPRRPSTRPSSAHPHAKAQTTRPRG
jgi:hypothetical protein